MRKFLKRWLTLGVIAVLINLAVWHLGMLLDFVGGPIDICSATLCESTMSISMVLIPLTIVYSIVRRFALKKSLDFLGPILAVLAMLIITVEIDALRGNSHEGEAAMYRLRGMVYTEEQWKSRDTDRNGRNDYWTYDLSCFYRMFRADDATKVQAISDSLAKADCAPAKDDIFGLGKIESWADKVIPVSYAGYLFRALTKDENGISYNQNLVGKVAATNDSRYGFIAVPSKYGISGRLTFIINQEGILYSTDPGSDEKKWINQWPAKDPTTIPGPGGEKWYSYGYK